MLNLNLWPDKIGSYSKISLFEDKDKEDKDYSNKDILE